MPTLKQTVKIKQKNAQLTLDPIERTGTLTVSAELDQALEFLEADRNLKASDVVNAVNKNPEVPFKRSDLNEALRADKSHGVDKLSDIKNPKIVIRDSQGRTFTLKDMERIVAERGLTPNQANTQRIVLEDDAYKVELDGEKRATVEVRLTPEQFEKAVSKMAEPGEIKTSSLEFLKFLSRKKSNMFRMGDIERRLAQDKTHQIDSLSQMGEVRVKVVDPKSKETLAESSKSGVSTLGNREISCKKARVKSLFDQDRLLLHAHETSSIMLSDTGAGRQPYLDLSPSMNKFTDLRRDGSRPLSSSLIVKGEPIVPFHKYGEQHHFLLLDPDKLELKRISPVDDPHGYNHVTSEVRAEGMKDLKELAVYHRSQKGQWQGHSEVHAVMNSEDAVIGVAGRDSPAKYTLLNAYLAREKYASEGINLPLFKYNQDDGSLKEWNPTKAELDSYVEKIPTKKLREVYTKAVDQAHARSQAHPTVSLRSPRATLGEVSGVDGGRQISRAPAALLETPANVSNTANPETVWGADSMVRRFVNKKTSHNLPPRGLAVDFSQLNLPKGADVTDAGLYVDASNRDVVADELARFLQKKGVPRESLARVSDLGITTQEEYVEWFREACKNTDGLRLLNKKFLGTPSKTAKYILAHESNHHIIESIPQADRQAIWDSMTPEQRKVATDNVCKRWKISPKNTVAVIKEHFTDGLTNHPRKGQFRHEGRFGLFRGEYSPEALRYLDALNAEPNSTARIELATENIRLLDSTTRKITDLNKKMANKSLSPKELDKMAQTRTEAINTRNLAVRRLATLARDEAKIVTKGGALSKLTDAQGHKNPEVRKGVNESIDRIHNPEKYVVQTKPRIQLESPGGGLANEVSMSALETRILDLHEQIYGVRPEVYKSPRHAEGRAVKFNGREIEWWQYSKSSNRVSGPACVRQVINDMTESIMGENASTGAQEIRGHLKYWIRSDPSDNWKQRLVEKIKVEAPSSEPARMPPIDLSGPVTGDAMVGPHGAGVSSGIRPVLIGVSHVPGELDQVSSSLLRDKPGRVGLELPEDYLRRPSEIGFFGELASRLKAQGIEVVPLEKPELWGRFKAVEVAKAVSDGKFSVGDIEASIATLKAELKVENPYAPPESSDYKRLLIKRLESGLQILEENPSPSEVMGLWDDVNAQREAHALQRINEVKPDRVVMGRGHTDTLQRSLPEFDYRFTPQASASKVQEGERAFMEIAIRNRGVLEGLNAPEGSPKRAAALQRVRSIMQLQRIPTPEAAFEGLRFYKGRTPYSDAIVFSQKGWDAFNPVSKTGAQTGGASLPIGDYSIQIVPDGMQGNLHEAAHNRFRVLRRGLGFEPVNANQYFSNHVLSELSAYQRGPGTLSDMGDTIAGEDLRRYHDGTVKQQALTDTRAGLTDSDWQRLDRALQDPETRPLIEANIRRAGETVRHLRSMGLSAEAVDQVILHSRNPAEVARYRSLPPEQVKAYSGQKLTPEEWARVEEAARAAPLHRASAKAGAEAETSGQPPLYTPPPKPSTRVPWYKTPVERYVPKPLKSSVGRFAGFTALFTVCDVADTIVDHPVETLQNLPKNAAYNAGFVAAFEGGMQVAPNVIGPIMGAATPYLAGKEGWEYGSRISDESISDAQLNVSGGAGVTKWAGMGAMVCSSFGPVGTGVGAGVAGLSYAGSAAVSAFTEVKKVRLEGEEKTRFTGVDRTIDAALMGFVKPSSAPDNPVSADAEKRIRQSGNAHFAALCRENSLVGRHRSVLSLEGSESIREEILPEMAGLKEEMARLQGEYDGLAPDANFWKFWQGFPGGVRYKMSQKSEKWSKLSERYHVLRNGLERELGLKDSSLDMREVLKDDQLARLYAFDKQGDAAEGQLTQIYKRSSSLVEYKGGAGDPGDVATRNADGIVNRASKTDSLADLNAEFTDFSKTRRQWDAHQASGSQGPFTAGSAQGELPRDVPSRHVVMQGDGSVQVMSEGQYLNQQFPNLDRVLLYRDEHGSFTGRNTLNYRAPGIYNSDYVQSRIAELDGPRESFNSAVLANLTGSEKAEFERLSGNGQLTPAQQGRWLELTQRARENLGEDVKGKLSNPDSKRRWIESGNGRTLPPADRQQLIQEALQSGWFKS
ncbi:MAG: hypothetical protein ABH851_06835 [Methanobacteriota archaeon]